VKISVSIITFNEEQNIAEAIESLSWADEILVVDSGSEDNTKQISEGLGARVIEQSWLGFSKQKQFAIDNCSNNWVFSLDADERVSDALKAKMIELKQTSDDNLADGYRISRLSYYMGRPIHHGGWYPDWQLRFFDRRKGQWNNLLVHESFQMNDDANIEKLSLDILHYTVNNASHHNKMIGERYAPLAAEQMYREGKRTSRFRVATAGFISFVRTFFLKAGFLDGFPGFCIARFGAHSAYLKHLLLWEKQNAAK